MHADKFNCRKLGLFKKRNVRCFTSSTASSIAAPTQVVRCPRGVLTRALSLGDLSPTSTTSEETAAPGNVAISQSSGKTVHRIYMDQAVQTDVCGDLLRPILTGVQAHECTLTNGFLLEGGPDLDYMLLVTASMDKTVAAWRFRPAVSTPYPYVEVQKMVVPGGPLFSLALSDTQKPGGVKTQYPEPPMLYCGTAAKKLVSWKPFESEFCEIKLGEHPGWVRALATYGRFLYSCGSNFLRQWDTTYAVPKEVASVNLNTGDILAVVADKTGVFTAGADGSIRSWILCDRRHGNLKSGPVMLNAHDGRITSLIQHGDMIFSASSDGSIKVWDKQTLTQLGEIPNAHGGQKVHCLVEGPGSLLFSGGDDHMIRGWDMASLAVSNKPFPASYCISDAQHNAPVRMLLAGSNYLVSGDSQGAISIWSYGAAVTDAVANQATLKTATAGKANEAACVTASEEHAGSF